MIALAAAFGLTVTQLDVKTAFLYAPLEETIFMHHPEGMPCTPGTVLRLKKNLYGLKQAPRAWWTKLTSTFEALGFTACKTDSCILTHASVRCWLVVYVDDILIITADASFRSRIVSSLRK